MKSRDTGRIPVSLPPARAVLSIVFALLVVASSAAAANQYILSGSVDGTKPFYVDDNLDVYLNGTLYSTTNVPPGTPADRAPIPITANTGDELRFVVRDTYGDCTMLTRLYLTDPAGRRTLIEPGFDLGCGRPAGDQGVSYDQTRVIPALVAPPELVEVALPGSTLAGLTAGPDGLFYGVTYDGGDAANKGTIYSFDPWLMSVATRHTFAGATDGAAPYGELTFDPVSRFLFGTTHSGGPTNEGTIFLFHPPTNGFVTLKSTFQGYTAPRGALVIANGFLYGTLAYPSGAVFRMAKDGSGFTIIHAFADFGSLPQPLTLGPDGRLYGSTQYGGLNCNALNPSYGCGTLFSLKAVLPGDMNTDFQTLFQFQFGSGTPCPTPPGANCVYHANYPTENLTYAADGMLYGATYYSVFKADPANAAATIQFLTPSSDGISTSVSVGPDNRLYVAEYSGKVDTAGRIYSVKKDGTDFQLHRAFSFTAGTKAYGPYGRVHRDAAGTIFGTTEYVNVAPYRGTVFAKSTIVDITVNVTIAGSGAGTVASVAPGIDCAPTCSAAFNGVVSVTLEATPADANSVFTGWLGACTGRAACVIRAAGVRNVKAVFAPNDIYALRLDADENNAHDALTDGLLIIRYLFGIVGPALTAGALGPGAGLMTPDAVIQHLDDIQPLLDVDGNGQVDALTDGLLILRYLFALRGPGLITGAIGPDAIRTTAPQIEAYLASVLP